jgi:hypothetical protein
MVDRQIGGQRNLPVSAAGVLRRASSRLRPLCWHSRSAAAKGLPDDGRQSRPSEECRGAAFQGTLDIGPCRGRLRRHHHHGGARGGRATQAKSEQVFVAERPGSDQDGARTAGREQARCFTQVTDTPQGVPIGRDERFEAGWVLISFDEEYCGGGLRCRAISCRSGPSNTGSPRHDLPVSEIRARAGRRRLCHWATGAYGNWERWQGRDAGQRKCRSGTRNSGRPRPGCRSRTSDATHDVGRAVLAGETSGRTPQAVSRQLRV